MATDRSLKVVESSSGRTNCSPNLYFKSVIIWMKAKYHQVAVVCRIEIVNLHEFYHEILDQHLSLSWNAVKCLSIVALYFVFEKNFKVNFYNLVILLEFYLI